MHTFRFFSKIRILAAIAAGLVLTVAISSVTAFAHGCEEIRESVLRLHILANSDSEADQNLKLAVRDRILELDATLFQEAENLDDAEEAAREKLELIRRTALAEIQRQGYDYEVHAELRNMYFSTREYDTFTLPAGWYDAVRVTIGEGAGHNWWCVLYPPLCLPAAESSAQLDDVLTPEGEEIVTNPQKYKFSFALIELWEQMKSALFD